MPFRPISLTTNVDDLSLTRALRQGEITSPIMAVYTGFRAMVRERRFDIRDLAVTTCLWAQFSGLEVTPAGPWRKGLIR